MFATAPIAQQRRSTERIRRPIIDDRSRKEAQSARHHESARLRVERDQLIAHNLSRALGRWVCAVAGSNQFAISVGGA